MKASWTTSTITVSSRGNSIENTAGTKSDLCLTRFGNAVARERSWKLGLWNRHTSHSWVDAVPKAGLGDSSVGDPVVSFLPAAQVLCSRKYEQAKLSLTFALPTWGAKPSSSVSPNSATDGSVEFCYTPSARALPVQFQGQHGQISKDDGRWGGGREAAKVDWSC